MSEKVFDIIGENFNTTRRLKPTSPRVVHGNGKVGVSYGPADDQKLLDITAIFPTDPAKLRTYQIPHIAHALRCKNVDYISWVIRSQIDAGANIIDLCIDEIAIDPVERWTWMEWLVPVAQSLADVTFSIDSSDPDTIVAALKVYDGGKSRPAINSVNLEEGRQALIPLAAKHNALLFANASGREGMPKNAEERVANINQIMAMMDSESIKIEDRYLDPLAFPASTGSEFGNHYLDAVREIRRLYPNVHIFGGHSNTSFGLPQRKIMNNAFIILSILAGCDALMIDPILNPPKDFVDFKLAADVALGRDEMSMRYMSAFRKPTAAGGRRAPRAASTGA